MKLAPNFDSSDRGLFVVYTTAAGTPVTPGQTSHFLEVCHKLLAAGWAHETVDAQGRISRVEYTKQGLKRLMYLRLVGHARPPESGCQPQLSNTKI